ncbi:MAG: bifunctional metallophosphatase/5'-nucleotidase, partial [Nocardioidaceae bacterium]
VLLHQGATAPYTVGSDKVPAAAPAGWTCDKNGPLDPTSAVIPIAEQLDPAIDVVVTGHTHQPYVCDIPDPAGQSRLVTSASSFGRLFTDIRLTYDRRTQDIVRSSVTGSNKVVSRLVAPNPSLENLVNEYRTLVAPIANRRIGKITETLPKSGGPSKETPLGDLIADAQAADPSIAGGGPVDVAFMNPGGIRDDLKFPENTADGDAEGGGVVTFAEAFAVQPFNNFVASMDLTGAQILQLLNEQFTGKNAGSANWKFLQVSDGFSYSWRMVGDAPAIDQTSVRIKGVPLVAGQTYRVAANNFLSDGGDSFGTFVAGGNKIVGGLDIDAFANYLEAYTAAHGAWAPPATARITLLP